MSSTDELVLDTEEARDVRSRGTSISENEPQTQYSSESEKEEDRTEDEDDNSANSNDEQETYSTPRFDSDYTIKFSPKPIPQVEPVPEVPSKPPSPKQILAPQTSDLTGLTPEEQTKLKLLKLLYEAREEQLQLSKKNKEYQRQLSEYFRVQKVEEMPLERSIADQEKFLQILQELDAAREQLRIVQSEYDASVDEMKSRLDDKETKANEVKEAFSDFKRLIGATAEYSKTGKLISPQIIEDFEKQDSLKEQKVEKVRLKHITLRKQYATVEKAFRQKEELKNGLHLIDFEQLKIENQTFTEKIEERNEELQKLRKKITNTVHTLSHVREKLQFMHVQNTDLRKKLSGLEAQVIDKRDVVGTLKQERDALRTDNFELKQRAGLTGNDDLLRDFERRSDELSSAKDKLSTLKGSHKMYLERTNQVRETIEIATREQSPVSPSYPYSQFSHHSI